MHITKAFNATYHAQQGWMKHNRCNLPPVRTFIHVCSAVLGCDTVENNWLHYNVSANKTQLDTKSNLLGYSLC